MRRVHLKTLAGFCPLLLFVAAPAQAEETAGQEPRHKAGYEEEVDFGGPGSIQGQLEDDDRVKKPVFRFASIDRALEPWFDWKGRVHDRHGLSLGFDYNLLYQSIDDSIGTEDNAMSGVLRGYGLWTIVGKGTDNRGSLFFKVEQRSDVAADIPPGSLAGEAGYIGVTGLNFNDAGLLLADLNWQQRFNDGRTGFIVGRYDPNDYVNVLGYANPWTTFSNLAILLDASLALPDWSWGAGAGTWINDRWYVLGSINDANGSATNESFFEGGAEFITQMEVGWSPREERYFKNVHVTLWHVDARKDAGIDSAEGVLLSGNWTWDETWMVFGRVGFSDGDAPIYNESVTAGFGRLFRAYSDVLGVAVNRGDPPDGSLDSQTTTEIFYRLAFSQNLQLTPSIQFLQDPALNPGEDVLLFGLRLRLSL